MYDFTEAWLINFLILGVPFLAYFLGIVIRKKVMPGPKSPPLNKQLLLGIPISLVVVSPLLAVFRQSIHDTAAYLMTVGIIIEHGMILTETAARQLSQLINGG